MIGLRGKVSEGFYSQLGKVYYQFFGCLSFIDAQSKAASSYYIQTVKDAVSFQKPGYENLCIFPRMIPLEVDSCQMQNCVLKMTLSLTALAEPGMQEALVDAAVGEPRRLTRCQQRAAGAGEPAGGAGGLGACGDHLPQASSQY